MKDYLKECFFIYFFYKNGTILIMNFHVITLFPESFDSYINESIIGRAIKDKKIKINFYNPRLFVTGKKYKKMWPDGNISQIVDDRPFGGGPGMIIRAEPVIKVLEKIIKKIDTYNAKQEDKKKKKKLKIIFFSPGGNLFTTEYASNTVKKYTDTVFICGRYEGIDARVYKIIKNIEHISVGDYVLTGGELPAMICLDVMARQIPGVLGNFDSREESRTASHDVYTRPEVLVWNKKEYPVPPVLLSGDHKKIEEWKKSQGHDE
jgi:tRNA (guanine37-N1)-methyltransferase